ncbi:MAG: hypothetical protein QF831_04005 [Candidatus Thalassarchaeaceae archaeon]|nr:hypothetical protein [Candidatus Thalassarchaeaceae archaeon]
MRRRLLVLLCSLIILLAPAIGIVSQDGYEWLQQGGATWYRPANSGLDWAQWMD